MTHPEAFAYDESLLGVAPTFAGYHGYEPSIPLTWADHKASKIQDRPYAMANIKGLGSTQVPTQVVAFAETVPPRTIIVLNHEPSNPDKSIDPAEFVRTFNDTYEQFHQAREDGRIDVTVELWSNFMSYLWRTPERDPADWIPRQPGGELTGDGILLNGYWGPTTATFDQIFGPALDWLDAEFETYRWGIGEISCHTESHVGQPNGAGTLYDGPWLSDEDAQQWVLETFSDAETAGAEIIAWFSSPVGPRGPWHLDGATGAGIAEWWG